MASDVIYSVCKIKIYQLLWRGTEQSLSQTPTQRILYHVVNQQFNSYSKYICHRAQGVVSDDIFQYKLMTSQRGIIIKSITHGC